MNYDCRLCPNYLITLSDFNLFTKLKLFFAGKKFKADEEVRVDYYEAAVMVINQS